MELGTFSISLSVKDLQASRAFYEKFGFTQLAGDESMNYLIVKNGDHLIGLFQGMFEGNMLTFNPGWDTSGQNLDTFTDVREIQRELKAEGFSVDEMLEAEVTAEYDERWGSGFIDPRRLVESMVAGLE